MVEIKKLDNALDSGIGYGGHSGSKKGIIIDGEKWLLKYPKSTRSMDVPDLSYTTMPLSEYLGSQIYKSLEIDVQKTILGITNNKIVVACKDFLKNTETILDFNAIKNDYDESLENYLEERSSSKFDRNNDLQDIIAVMDNNKYFKMVPNLRKRFWDMFIVDAFISNNDRNEGNWGVIIDKESGNLRLAPVYDNGAAFYSKNSSEKLASILNDDKKFKQAIYDSAISTFTENGKIINPLKYIESMKSYECNEALLRIYPKIDMERIEELFENVPFMYDGLLVMSSEQREMYYKSLEYKYKNIFMKVYNTLQNSPNKKG